MLDMPALSPTMSTGNLVAWMVKPGDEIFPGQILAEIETDKATLPFENQEDGFIASLLVAAGTQGVAVGTPLAVVVGEAADMAKMAGWSPSPSQAASSSPTAAPPIPAASQPPPTDASWSSRIGPAAQIILAAAGINPSAIVGTGPKGIITKSDALQAAANPPKAVSPAPATDSKQAADVPLAKVPTPAKAPSPTKGPTSAPPDGAEYEDTPVTTMRRVIASRLLESKTTIPAM